ncbi:hypothetical protein LAC81_26010 [Ensifer adhaerens]|uniref:cupin domain-containing protein n=1 Tax=Ensifer adhaerens TaxID=106592 RepID=UPI001CC06BC8|nr:hypothetical protein [Ensifer adhaerens]MBZ7924180.1 hypothetical protein [Ensifer adhaerens]UAX96562.1 hypothetical protein LAC78_22475 [Ensifer adhaerens]UAY04094.1 hypothetical protein LAC80_22485 [Ensifer adhaerens]UAY12080.1 hypothetical protein LAC81_26010 [Ensifer adhaerens]
MGKYVVDQWPPAPSTFSEERRRDFTESLGNGRVGSRLLSETDNVRVWSLTLQPGERIGFHTHVLNYFWTAVTAGSACSHYADGHVANVSYEAGDTKHYRFDAGQFMIHDLENTGATTLMFTTVEFLDSPNAPLSVRS